MTFWVDLGQVVDPDLFTEGAWGGWTPLPDPLVPIWSSVAYVNKSWDDATGQIGDRGKPFLTPQAAITALPFQAKLVIEDGIYSWIGNTLDCQWKNISITLHNANIWNNIINANYLNIDWIWSTRSANTNRAQVTGQIDTNFLYMTNVAWIGAELTSWHLTQWYFSNCEIQSVNNPTFLLNDTSNFSIVDFWNCYISTRDTSFIDWTNNDTYVLWKFYWCSLLSSDFLSSNSELFTWLNNNFLISFVNGNVLQSSWDVFSWVSTWTSQFGTSLTLDISNCEVKSENWYIMNMSWANTMDLKSYNSTIISGQSENINRASNPANVVNLKSSSISKRPWNTLGVVNAVVANDFIDANIT